MKLDFNLLESSRYSKGNYDTWEEWYDFVSKEQKSALKEVMPSAGILEEVRRESPRCLQTFFWYPELGIGVLSTNPLGENYCAFLEKERAPSAHVTCSPYELRYGLILPIRTAVLDTQRALKKKMFRRCNKNQYIKGGELRRLAI